MSAQDVIIGSRAIHVRELKTEVAALKSENAALRRENEQLKSHFALAVLAARDLGALADGAKMVIYDGWNLVLGADRIASSRKELVDIAARELEENPGNLAWIIFDGPRENSFNEGGLRVSYTGGEGGQRADRLIGDFVRMAKFAGLAHLVEVKTFDRALLRAVGSHR